MAYTSNPKGVFFMIDLTEKRFGKLTVTYLHHRTPIAYWFCKCDCGNEKIIRLDHLYEAKSCGCIPIIYPIKHGKSKSWVYLAWIEMRRRCYKPEVQSFKNYGGRGISVCNPFIKFQVHFKGSLQAF